MEIATYPVFGHIGYPVRCIEYISIQCIPILHDQRLVSGHLSFTDIQHDAHDDDVHYVVQAVHYDVILPTTSVVIIFTNEAWSLLSPTDIILMTMLFRLSTMTSSCPPPQWSSSSLTRPGPHSSAPSTASSTDLHLREYMR